MTGFSAWLVLAAAEIAGNASVVAGIGLIGLFPTGTPQRRGERWVLAGVAALAVLLPLLVEMSSAAPPTDLFPHPGRPTRCPGWPMRSAAGSVCNGPGCAWTPEQN